MKNNIDQDSRFLEGDPEEHHISSNSFLTGIWVGLLLLTALTVLVSVLHKDFIAFSVVTALIIASTKAMVVIYHFMHLKFDSQVLKVMVYVVFGVFTVLIGLTAFDYLTRV